MKPTIRTANPEISVPPNQVEPKRYLFVMGVPRSGTTGLASLLNCNRNIALGIERFIKYRGLLEEKMFSPESFFDFETYQCTEGSRKSCEALMPRYDAAIAVGDKIPMLYDCLRGVASRFLDATFIVIVRDPLDIARSWNGRAAQATWPVWKRDVLSAVHHQQMWTNLLLYEHPEKVILLDYDAAYRDDMMSFAARISNEIEVPLDIDTLVFASVARRSTLRNETVSPHTVEEASAQIVLENVDSQIHRYVRERGGLCRLSEVPRVICRHTRQFYADREMITEVAITHLLERFGGEYEATLLCLRGNYRLESGRVNEAKDDFHTALAVAPDCRPAKRGLRMVRDKSSAT